MKTLYDIAENEELNFPTSEISNCQLCVNWFENFGSSLENCTSYTEKIRLLSAAPICQMPKNLIFSKWPHVTDHMVRKARLIVTEKGNYSTPDPYSGHPIDENVRKVALEYYLNDDLSCSSQSPNKNDSINVYENDVKVVKIKRYMTRSIYETYQMFKQDHSDLKIGHSKFYDLRPKWVVTSPAKQVCLCIYCTNFDLLLVGLKNCLNRYGVIVMNVREIVLSAGVCSVENDACVFKECVECPGIDGIIRKISEFLKDEIQEEMTYAFWEGNDLIKKTTTIEIFIKTLSEWTLKVNTHLQCKEIQQNGIRLEKEISKQNSSHLILHIDFAENWSVIVQNEVQSYHWKSKQISIFTAVCYFGQNTESYVVVTDDLSHDSAHALLAIDKIVSDINQRFPNIVTQSMTIISDGAPSHFKNRFQLDEFKTMKLQRKWLFSATGHGKGACDGIGGLVKHFATRHNLSVDETQYIQSAQAFVEIVQMKTPKIRHILLEVNELEGFREKKKKKLEKNTSI